MDIKWNNTVDELKINVSMVRHTLLFNIVCGQRQLMLDAVIAWRTHQKGLSLNLKDGREILELAHPCIICQ